METPDQETVQKMLKVLKPMPVVLYDGVPFPAFMPFRLKGAENAVKDIIDLQTRDTDIMICTYAKSGTHWIYEIISLLVQNTTELTKDPKSKAMLEAMMTPQDIDNIPNPRILDSHLHIRHLPRKLVADKCKIVHVVRNPKDVCVSYFYHQQKDLFTRFEGTWDEFVEQWFSEKDIPYGTWYDYELDMERVEKDNPGLIYTCYYEQLKKNPAGEIKKLSDYLGTNCTDDTIEEIAKVTSFENMHKNKFDITKLVDGKGFIYRKGEIGDWKNHFTVAQNERFDQQFKEKMKNSSYQIVFE